MVAGAFLRMMLSNDGTRFVLIVTNLRSCCFGEPMNSSHLAQYDLSADQVIMGAPQHELRNPAEMSNFVSIRVYVISYLCLYHGRPCFKRLMLVYLRWDE